jgi:hypothetical protein
VLFGVRLVLANVAEAMEEFALMSILAMSVPVAVGFVVGKLLPFKLNRYKYAVTAVVNGFVME